jgi:hypothetical protein
MEARKKYRVQLDFDQQGLNELEALKRELRAGSRADTVRYGLGLLRWAADQLKSGARILTEKDGQLNGVVFPFLPTQQIRSASTEVTLRRPIAEDAARQRRVEIRDTIQEAAEYGKEAYGQERFGERERG